MIHPYFYSTYSEFQNQENFESGEPQKLRCLGPSWKSGIVKPLSFFSGKKSRKIWYYKILTMILVLKYFKSYFTDSLKFLTY